MIIVMTPGFKRVTAKPFLNKQIKPHVDNEGTKLYPLYLKVAYNKTGTQFPISVPSSGKLKEFMHYTDEKSFEQRFLGNRNELSFEVQALYFEIERAIKYELAKYGEEKFDLKGFGLRLQNYRILLLPSYFTLGRIQLHLFLKKRLSIDEIHNMRDLTQHSSILDYLIYLKGFGRIDNIPRGIILQIEREILLMHLNIKYENKMLIKRLFRKEISYLDWILDYEIFKNYMEGLFSTRNSDGIIDIIFGHKNYDISKFDQPWENYYNQINLFVSVNLHSEGE